MIRKNMMKKIMTVALVAAMAVGTVGVNGTATVKADGASDEQNYIVQTASEKTADDILDEYSKVQTVSEMGEAGVNDNTFTVALDANEAEELKEKSETVSVEKDSILEGFSDEDNKTYQNWDEEKNLQWNLDMIGAKDVEASNVKDKIKVAVIDSGIDYSDDIDVVERKNFIPEQDEVSILYEDGSGHGTGVAGIIAAKDNDEGITGIDENVELYSAKVLDANNQAPVSRVVKAIRWAIEKKVNIINLSMGTSTYSEILHNAIKEAAAQNILVVCAAGNGGAVQYPAAFDETLAVGSVGAEGTVSSESSVGDELDVVAPGEQILSTSAFDGVMASGGTSMAAPHVSGVAARLWEKNIEAPADFIKMLICDSAKSVGDDKNYGNGIVDLEYALENFDEAWDKYSELKDTSLISETKSTVVKENSDSIKCFEDCGIIEGRWTRDGHQDLLRNQGLSQTKLNILKKGIVISDDYVAGMQMYPEFHGYSGTDSKTNYVASYILLTKMAQSYYNGKYKDPTNVKGLDNVTYDKMCKKIGGGINGVEWSTILKGYEITNHNKSLILYGMALHTLTDTFAHSAYVQGRRIRHEDINNDGKIDADDSKYSEKRYKCANESVKKALNHISGGVGDITDFIAGKNIHNNTFDIYQLSKFAKMVNEDKYKTFKNDFDNMSC